jgi:hypothetical protein
MVVAKGGINGRSKFKKRGKKKYYKTTCVSNVFELLKQNETYIASFEKMALCMQSNVHTMEMVSAVYLMDYINFVHLQTHGIKNLRWYFFRDQRVCKKIILFQYTF